MRSSKLWNVVQEAIAQSHNFQTVYVPDRMTKSKGRRRYFLEMEVSKPKKKCEAFWHEASDIRLQGTMMFPARLPIENNIHLRFNLSFTSSWTAGPTVLSSALHVRTSIYFCWPWLFSIVGACHNQKRERVRALLSWAGFPECEM